ncbi:hypothetical protein JD77_05896 [Micromonospora olivasterospora]|uniref:Uncharacterized protein n=1 Tax=Micromonospora olivasterospora TaxID=1880 RepID=A0A562IIM6_MICOL|nr:hypothetical protein JD77_05896 [Micromonospora olivasterospora]
MGRLRNAMAATGCAALLASLLVTVDVAAASPPTAPAAQVAIAPAGRGYATPKLIDQRTNSPARQTATTADHPVLGVDGKPTGATLPAGISKAAKPSAAATSARIPDGPNTGPSGQPRAPSPTTINSNFAGIDQAGGGGAQPSDINASVGTTQIMETVNRRVTVFSKTGVLQCTNTLAGWLGLGTTNVFDPRTIYDNLNNRFVIIATTSGTAGAAPRLFLAASTTSNACGSYFVYTLTFTGALFPNGMLLDYPYLGQDRTAILSSTNNFNPGYVNSTAWSVSKAQLYVGGAVSFPAFSVAFSTAPVTVTGIPIAATANTYYVAGVPGTGYNLYRMNNSAGPGTTLVLQATIASAYAAPSRRVNQCGTTVTLDPLDGRIAWAPVQARNSTFVWFTHGQNIGGFPGVRYGAINTATNTVTVANAFHSGTSDDFNPSLGAFETAPNSFNIWLNWAYTDTGATTCTNTSTTFNGVLPGGGLPALTGSDITLVTGSNTTTNTRFGDYSSVHVDPVPASGTCPAGSTALLAQQYFVGGNWATRLARVSIGPGC